MVWGQKDSNDSVTVAYLLERQVALSWQEAVAIALETAEMAERSGRGTVPRDQNIELKSGGTLEFLRGRVETGAPVSSVAVMLNALLPKDRPTQLRLLVSTAGPGSETYKSLGEFVEALKYFERPGRRQVLAEIHRRALETPIPVDAPGDKTAPRPAKKKKPPMSAGRRWAVAAAVLLAIGAGAVAVAEKSEPGMVTGRTAVVQATAATWWASAMEATAWFREAASEDLAIVVERLEVAGGDLTEDLRIGDGDAAIGEEEAEEADVEVTESTEGSAIEPAPSDSSAAVAPAPEVKPEAATGDDAAPDLPNATRPDANSTVASVEPVAEAPRGLLASSALFDSRDLHVTPPTTVRLQLPELVDEGPPGTSRSGSSRRLSRHRVRWRRSNCSRHTGASIWP